MLRDLLISACLLLGATFALIGSIGLARLGDFYMRLHGPTKATTLGVGGMLVASALYFSTRGNGVSLHELLVAAFLFLTAPASAHLMTRAARHLGVPECPVGQNASRTVANARTGNVPTPTSLGGTAENVNPVSGS